MVQVLQHLPKTAHPWVGDETGPMDDAAIVRPIGADGLVLTIDVITPIVDDPRAFGRIAAANALSDVYAMGGRPQVALSFAGVPDAVGLDVLEAILAGLAEKTAEAGAAIVGGHTIRDAEPKCGLAVIGTVGSVVWSQKNAAPGQALVLTKPIGTGVLGQAIKAGVADPAHVAEAIRSMEALNAEAAARGLETGATAATDVTGFGLLGHLHHLASASGLTAELWCGAVPVLAGARAAIAAGKIPGGTRRNLAYAAPHAVGLEGLPEAERLLLADAQTSGGLLLALPAERADALARALPGAAVVGRLAPPRGKSLAVLPDPG